MEENTNEKMSPEEFRRRMELCVDEDDPWGAHINADRLMCKVLRQHGYGDGVEIFVNMTKWYD